MVAMDRSTAKRGNVYHQPVHSRGWSVRRALVSIAALGILPLASSACSSPSTSSTGTTAKTTTTASTSSRTLCTTVSPAQIAATTGVKVSPAQTTSTKTTVTCTYKAADLSKSVIILYSIDVTAADFASQAKRANSAHGPITRVSHLGDGAYYFTVPAQDSTITTLVVVHGQAEIVITSTAGLTQVQNLAQLILFAFSSKG